MNIASIKNLVKFKPAELRAAIRQLHDRAADLERERQELLALAATYQLLLQSALGESAEPGKETPPPATHAGERFAGMSVREAAFLILSEAGESLHGKEIMQRLERGGRKVGGKFPMNALTTTMLRDVRIERDKGQNMWRVKKGAANQQMAFAS